MKILALLFLILILVIIVAADMDAIPTFIRDLYRFPGGDKIGHFILFGILAYLLARAFPRLFWVGRFTIPMVILALMVFTILEEISQSYFADRTASLPDLLSSLLGILLGTWLAAGFPLRQADAGKYHEGV